MPGLDQLFSQIAAFWGGLTGAQRVALFSTALITVGAVALVVNLGQRSDYGTLYANLDPDDAASIVDELSTMQVPFELTHAGTAIQVPVERVYDVRLELAQKGLPASGPVGLEVFDDSPLGMTPFQQRVRFQRAMEGELGRSITRLAPVHWARVHINVPDRRVFRRDQAPATASVVLSLVPGGSLSAGEARGIAQLIAGAVEGLDTSQVSILDASGRLLLRPKGNEEEALAAEAIDTQRGIERQLAKRAQNLLDAALGAGRSVVTVSASVDMRRVESKEDLVNPDQAAVVSEQRSEETRSEPTLVAGGVPGAAANVPGGGGPGGGGAAGPSSETVTRETINFDFSRTTQHTVVPMGAIQKLSVALLVDGTYAVPEGTEVAEGEEPPAPQYQPRTEEEMEQLSEIVRRAVGFDAERGDVIAAHNVPFRSPLEDLPAAEPPGFLERPEMLMLLSPILRVVALLGGLMLLVLMVIRPTMKQLAAAAAIGPGTQAGALPAGAAAGALEGGQDEAGELAIPVNKADAKQVADAIRQWLRE